MGHFFFGSIESTSSLYDIEMTAYSPYIYNQLQIVILTFFGYLQSTANSHFNVFLAICSRLQIAILTFFDYLQSTANSHFNGSFFDYL